LHRLFEGSKKLDFVLFRTPGEASEKGIHPEALTGFLK